MANVIDYIKWRGDMDFDCVPFNEVDNLILTQLVYLDLTGLVPKVGEKGSVTLEEIYGSFQSLFPEDKRKDWFIGRVGASKILDVIYDTPRFKDIKLYNYVSLIDEELETQFVVATMELSDGSIFVSFSGTDSTVVGWKENFNMSYLDATPGQQMAVEYVNSTIPLTKSRIRFGGHSKGGNLAVYAAVKAKKVIQRRLVDVYNNDGPGFTQKMVSLEEYRNIIPKLHTILPHSSVVGMLLEHQEKYIVVESSEHGIMQHDALSWQVLGPHFVHMDELTKSSQILNQSIEGWLASMDDQQRQEFVDALFNILEKAKINNFSELSKLSLRKAAALFKASDGITSQSMVVLRKTIRLLIEQAGKTIRSGK